MLVDGRFRLADYQVLVNPAPRAITSQIPQNSRVLCNFPSLSAHWDISFLNLRGACTGHITDRASVIIIFGVIMKELASKLQSLKDALSERDSVLVLYSGGVDSTLLLKVASTILKERALAITATSDIYPANELAAAKAMGVALEVEHLLVPMNHLEDPDFASNPPDRCYHCKRRLLDSVKNIAEERGIGHILEWNVRSPLKDVELTKAEVRELSRQMNLSTWDKPSSPCLATRFPYGVEITREKLLRVGEAEAFLSHLGIGQLRVREHEEIARIEVGRTDMQLLLDDAMSQRITDKLKSLGYQYVTLDLQGYRMGSMNEPLERAS
jgi:uncharacterized protein